MDGCALTSSWFMTAVISRPLTSKGDILFKFLPLHVYRESSQTLISTFFFYPSSIVLPSICLSAPAIPPCLQP